MHCGKQVSLRGVTALFLLLGAVFLASLPASARGTAAGDGTGHAKSPVGSWDMVSTSGHGGLWIINSDGTWSTNYRDSGTWLALKKAVVFRVDSSAGGRDLGCVYLGTLNKQGINSASRQGPQNCSGSMA